jgi:peptidoglycan/LPS O-acetylase OafA/YrhL
MIAFVSMVTFCSAYHLYYIYQPKNVKKSFANSHGCFEQVVKSFSVLENLQKLMQQSNDNMGLGCVNGIKALSMLFILGGHSLLFLVGGPSMNSGFFKHESGLLQNAFLLNTPLLVDSFLLLSGFLFARILFVEMDKRKGRVNFLVLYVFRYIRLTPAYLAMIGLYATWLPKIGNGPLWNARMVKEQERCQMNWWLNLLYVNNYVDTGNLCMFQSWYLATDTQMFILAPLVLYPLWKWRRVGVYLLAAMTSVSVVIPFLVTYVNRLDPTFLMFADEVFDVSLNEYFIHTYGKTHMRATAYFFGILAGYLVYEIQEKK